MGKRFWADLTKVGIVLGVIASIVTILRGLDEGGAGVRR